MYCNHCLPCPAGIDIAEVTRLLDRMGMRGSMFEPETLRASYSALTAHAGDCTSCASCEARCPFHVGVVANMQRAAAVFGG